MTTLQIEHRAGGVAQIPMSRPEVFNAFDEAMIGELDAAFVSLEADANVRVIVLAGAGFAELEVGPITPAVPELTAATIARVRGTEMARQGFVSFLPKRPASWVNES
jgi:Enoyl-CoA hydratase/isomerase